MVSFDSAAKSGYPLKDWGNWQTEDWYDFLKDFDEPEYPELWKVDLQFGGQDLAKVLSETYPVREYFGDIVEEKYFNKRRIRNASFYQQEVAHILWKRIPYISIPPQTETNSWFSKTGRHKELRFGSFVMLVQPKVDFVLVAIDLRECYATLGYDWSVFKPPYYVVTMVRKQMAKSWITNLLEIAHKNLPTNRSGLTWTEINELTKPKVSRLVEIRDFQTIPEMKLLNWSDSSIIMDYMELSPNPLRPFLWYLELQPAQYNSRYSEKGNWFIPYGRLTRKLFGDVFTDGYLAHQRYMLGGKKLFARTTPRKAWEYNQNVAPHQESSWETEMVLEPENPVAGWYDSRDNSVNINLANKGLRNEALEDNYVGLFDTIAHEYGHQVTYDDTADTLPNPYANPYSPITHVRSPYQTEFAAFMVQTGGDFARSKLLAVLHPSCHYEILQKLPMDDKGFISDETLDNFFSGLDLVNNADVVIQAKRIVDYPQIPAWHKEWLKHFIRYVDTGTSAETKSSYSSDTYGRVMNKHLCPICEGPIPNAEHEGKYPGAMSRWDNVSEICSMCGSAEAMSPLLNPDARMLMQASREFDDFELWREGVLLGRPAVVEMQQASMEAAKKLREMED